MTALGFMKRMGAYLMGFGVLGTLVHFLRYGPERLEEHGDHGGRSRPRGAVRLIGVLAARGEPRAAPRAAGAPAGLKRAPVPDKA